MKKVFIKIWGCQMNVYDAELIKEILSSSGYIPTDAEGEADIVLLQTCSVRESAEMKVFNHISTLIHKKRKLNNALVIGVCGCMAENQGDYIRKKYPQVDILCGPNNYVDLPAMLEQVYGENGNGGYDIGSDRRFDYPVLTKKHSGSKFQAYVAVMRGCDNFCSYCIVPYVRGREASRPVDEIKSEVVHLVGKGCKEITLLGQNVNSYDDGNGGGFVNLLETLNSIDGLARIRFLTSHPKDAEENLFRAIRDLDKVCPFLHLPMQSGSDKILKAMNRKYTSNEYLRKIETARSIVPHIALSSDFIVGFPGESDEDFMMTFEAIEKIGYDSTFIFKYSERSGTKAAYWVDDVPKEKKEERNIALLSLQEKISSVKNHNYIGKTLSVLVEGVSKRNSNRLSGRSPDFKNVVFSGDDSMVGNIVNVKINRATSLTLFGDLSNE